MRKYRRHAIVVILIVAYIITRPIRSQTLISLPLYILYEVSIIISAVVIRNKRKQGWKKK